MNLEIPKWMYVMREIYVSDFVNQDIYAFAIARRLRLHMEHTTKLLQELERARWILRNKHPHKRLIKLTEDGKGVASLCHKLIVHVTENIKYEKHREDDKR